MGPAQPIAELVGIDSDGDPTESGDRLELRYVNRITSNYDVWIDDLRGWYKTRTFEDGADSLIIRRTTHAPPRDVEGGYQRFSWDATCREVAKLKVQILDGGTSGLLHRLLQPADRRR